jgi:CRP-like cAMP-binding protein
MRLRDPEPCSLDAKYIAEWLEAAGRPRSAAFVRHLGNRVREANLREADLRDRTEEVLARLRVYEPPEERVVVSYQPPPESSD